MASGTYWEEIEDDTLECEGMAVMFVSCTMQAKHARTTTFGADDHGETIDFYCDDCAKLIKDEEHRRLEEARRCGT